VSSRAKWAEEGRNIDFDSLGGRQMWVIGHSNGVRQLKATGTGSQWREAMGAVPVALL